MIAYAIAYVTALLVLFAADFVWLGLVAKDLYRGQIGHLMARDVYYPAALAFYVFYPAGLLIFAMAPNLAAGDWMKGALYGALFGFFCYSTYDLSNLATLREFPVKIALIDTFWGTALSGLAAALGVVIARSLSGAA